LLEHAERVVVLLWRLPWFSYSLLCFCGIVLTALFVAGIFALMLHPCAGWGMSGCDET
jgi:hypothetical protein